MTHPSRLATFARPFLCAALFLPALQASEPFEHQYAGGTPPKESVPPLVESRKSGGGRVSLDSGKLRVEVPVGANHFYTIEGTEDDGATAQGSTLDFSVVLVDTAPEQAAFSMRVGTGEGSWHVVFHSDQIRLGTKSVAHDTTQPDVYRLAIQDGKMTLYSARDGELFEAVRQEGKQKENRISFGTRSPLVVESPVVWELDFLRWTHNGAVFSRPAATE